MTGLLIWTPSHCEVCNEDLGNSRELLVGACGGRATTQLGCPLLQEAFWVPPPATACR